MSLAAVIWHAWIGVVLLLSVIPLIGAVGLGYFMKVVRPKYPQKR
jgi:hypothetical protein